MKKKVVRIIAMLFVLFCALIPFLIKVRVECVTQDGACPSELAANLNALENKNIFTAKLQTARLLNQNFLVSQFSLQFKLPNRIVARVLIKKPSFALYELGSKKYFNVHDNGVVLSIGTSSILPVVAMEGGEPKIGETLPEGYLTALKLTRGVSEMYQVKSSYLRSSDLHVELPGNLKVIFPLGESEIDVLLGGLRLIYSKITTESPGLYSEIDMRYKNPVLR